jgi:hypothetical protein
MPVDLTKLIDKLKTEAVGRCRERIEQAKYKAKGLLNGQKPEEKKDEPSNHAQSYGMTSVLKKRHGL